MCQTAKPFIKGHSQAARLPATPPKSETWDDFLAAIEGLDVPIDFLDADERGQGVNERDS